MTDKPEVRKLSFNSLDGVFIFDGTGADNILLAVDDEQFNVVIPTGTKYYPKDDPSTWLTLQNDVVATGQASSLIGAMMLSTIACAITGRGRLQLGGSSGQLQSAVALGAFSVY